MKLLGTNRVAEMVGVSPSTLRYWRSRDEGPPSFRVGKSIKYLESDVWAWLAGRREESARGEAATGSPVVVGAPHLGIS